MENQQIKNRKEVYRCRSNLQYEETTLNHEEFYCQQVDEAAYIYCRNIWTRSSYYHNHYTPNLLLVPFLSLRCLLLPSDEKEGEFVFSSSRRSFIAFLFWEKCKNQLVNQIKKYYWIIRLAKFCSYLKIQSTLVTWSFHWVS